MRDHRSNTSLAGMFWQFMLLPFVLFFQAIGYLMWAAFFGYLIYMVISAQIRQSERTAADAPYAQKGVPDQK